MGDPETSIPPPSYQYKHYERQIPIASHVTTHEELRTNKIKPLMEYTKCHKTAIQKIITSWK